MRGEVGLLSRQILIEGEMEDGCPSFNGNCNFYEVRGLDTFGAHIKVGIRAIGNTHSGIVKVIEML